MDKESFQVTSVGGKRFPKTGKDLTVCVSWAKEGSRRDLGVAAETEADQDKAQREEPGKGETCTNSETDVDKELENRQQIQYKLSYCQMSVQLHSECFSVPRTQQRQTWVLVWVS